MIMTTRTRPSIHGYSRLKTPFFPLPTAAAALFAGVPVPDLAGAPDGGGGRACKARQLLPAACQQAWCSDGGQAGKGGATGSSAADPVWACTAVAKQQNLLFCLLYLFAVV